MPDLLRAEVEDPEQTISSDDLRETRNYVRALFQGVDMLRDNRPIAVRMVRELHSTLLDGTRGENLRPGEFRSVQNFLGPPGSTVENARYVPPPVDEMHRLIGEWEQFANTSGGMPELVRCAILHHRFQAIHPFQDGNGRVGRLLIPLFLIDRKRLAQLLLYLSDYLEMHRRDYYDLLQQVHTENDWTSWIRFFLTGVAFASERALHQAKQMADLRRELREKLTKKFRARNLLDELFANPYVDTARVTERLKIDRKTASKSIELLVELGILREITGKKWGRLWDSPAILAIVNSKEKSFATK